MHIYFTLRETEFASECVVSDLSRRLQFRQQGRMLVEGISPTSILAIRRRVLRRTVFLVGYQLTHGTTVLGLAVVPTILNRGLGAPGKELGDLGPFISQQMLRLHQDAVLFFRPRCRVAIGVKVVVEAFADLVGCAAAQRLGNPRPPMSLRLQVNDDVVLFECKGIAIDFR
jgi:hypothetical protein